MNRTGNTRAPIYLTLAVFGLSAGVAYQAHSQSANSDPKPTKPFIAYERVVRFSSTQRPPLVQQGTFARRSDGSFTKTFDVTSPTGEIGRAVEIVDLRNRRVVILEPFTKSAITFYHSNSEMQEELRIQGTCVTRGLAGGTLVRPDRVWDNLLGRRVAQVVEDVRHARVERWVAPELDCYALRKSETSSKGAHNEMTVTKIEEGEPPDSMFEIPAGYVEASPLQVEAAYAAKFPGHTFWGGKAAKLVDERYIKSRN